MSWIRTGLVFLLVTFSAGCAGMSAQQQRVLSGGAIGTAAGVGTAALIGAPLIAGAAAGMAVGAVGGVVADELSHR